MKIRSKEFDKEMTSSNPLDFPGYQEKVEKIENGFK